MSNVQNELRELRRDFATKQREQIQAQTRLEESKKGLAVVNEKIREAGYEPKDLPKIIKKKTAELEKSVTEIRSMLENQDEDVDIEFE